ncbi:16S rRNA (cytidine(1402)-2'-O)-methyltransferase [Pseudomarimonas arenosa]|uniref:Ribosomal RNA small subunit methyltransferase I n=1 Tax=Pseudomarimonas arenosa TaxID=2774145 RepID=A0AAW3ZFY5_9GAMM|nr:16S rRNA (cytidine(1402)-2'-O)-methyltransferase [Pseudomarimonas arenosa]MBD8525048.1 16S rRNA (cytidine(1402)-2'-O)-methyltransferase [Pseudomarimonas arenosa]
MSESSPSSALEPGTLYVVATPIGNLGDLSPRAVQTLRGADVICAEDTRHSRPLLQQFGIDTPLLALHDHNEQAQAPALVERLRQGQALALISDAGTPLISDPGFRLVRAVREAGLKVSPVPGPSAVITALSAAGIASDRFLFEGFLPNKGAARRQRLSDLAALEASLVFYESSHRICESLADLESVFGDRRMALARELTKRFETILDGSIAEVRARVEADADQQRGEFVLIVEGVADRSAAQLAEGRRLMTLLSPHLPPSQAARLAAEISGAPRKALYARDS